MEYLGFGIADLGLRIADFHKAKAQDARRKEVED
jgi:hypothetical protein